MVRKGQTKVESVSNTPNNPERWNFKIHAKP